MSISIRNSKKNANVAISNPEQLYLTAKYVTKVMPFRFYSMCLIHQKKIQSFLAEDTMTLKCLPYFSYAMQWANSEVRRSAKHIAENVNTIFGRYNTNVRRTYEKRK